MAHPEGMEISEPGAQAVKGGDAAMQAKMAEVMQQLVSGRLLSAADVVDDGSEREVQIPD